MSAPDAVVPTPVPVPGPVPMHSPMVVVHVPLTLHMPSTLRVPSTLHVPSTLPGCTSAAARWAAALVVCLLFAVPGLAAQDRPPEGDPVPIPPGMCDIEDANLTEVSPPSPQRVEEAERLAAEASQAAILGDDEGALELLREAAEIDPTSAAIHYRLGRLLEGEADEEQAIVQFCHYLALTPGGPEAAEVRDRIERMAGPFEYADVDPEAAERAAERAAEEEETRASAAAQQRNADERAAERSAAEQRAAAERAAAEDSASAQATDGEQAPGALSPTPTTVLVTGMLMPGMGHIYAGESRTGLLVLGAAAGSVAAGMLYRRLEVECLVLPVDGTCPEGQERGRQETRPLLGPGVAAAAVITIGGAIHAYLSARDASPGFSSIEAGADGGVGFAVAREGAWMLTVAPAPSSDPHGIRAGLKVRF